MLIDIISKNGRTPLNVLERPDGTIDEDAEYILAELAKWFEVCSEAVYGTRPWRVFGEGDTRVTIDGFREEKTAWARSDFRFVQKDGAVYAFMMGIQPGVNRRCCASFGRRTSVHSVELLGVGQAPFHEPEFGVLSGQLPEEAAHQLY